MLFWIGVAQAQVAVWGGALGQAVLHEPGQVGGRLWLDLHGRQDGQRFTGIVRPGIGLDVHRSTTLTAGYAWVVGLVAESDALHEHRPWQQVLWSGSAGPLGLMLRGRFEQRLGAGVDGVGLRVRAFGRAQGALAGPIAWVVSDEAMVAVNDSDFLPAGFDQNRLFVGPALLGEGFRVEAGYLDLLALRDGAWVHTPVVSTLVVFTL